MFTIVVYYLLLLLLQHYQLFVVMMIMSYMLVHATNGWDEENAHLFTLSSCLLFNTTQLHYYCTDNEKDESSVPISVNDLNTFEVTEYLCGSYNNQGSYICLCKR